MQPRITARHFDLSDKIRIHAGDSINRLQKFFNDIISSEYFLTQNKNRFTVELKLSVYHDVISARAESHDLFAAIDQSADKAERQLKRYKGKLKDKDPVAITELSATSSRPKIDDDDLDV